MMEVINEAIAENLAPPVKVSVLGLFTVSEPVIICWVITLLLTVGAYLLTRNLKIVPSKSQVILEASIGGFNNFCEAQLGKHWRPFAPWLGTLFLFLLFSNLLGLIGVMPPTKTLSLTAALALLSMLLIYGSQMRYRGLVGGLLQFSKPLPFMVPFNLLDMFTRPLSLCMRLFGNMMAAHMVMGMIHAVVPLVVPIVFSLYFDLFDGLMQAFVFVFLTLLFTSEGIHDHE
ncbi:MAG: synthase subunit [Firmicutes bacterium]|nr:synthase subunit [Bacillota bacterium]